MKSARRATAHRSDEPGEEREEGARLSIGALSRATGIATVTLRTWERRYGFPAAERKPSGHRLYPLSAVARLRRIARVLAEGHRAAEVVSARDEELTRLLQATRGGDAPPHLEPEAAAEVPVSELLELVRRFDAGRLTRILLSDRARLDPLDFLESRLSPLIRSVGEAWENEELEIRHEHFLSERVGDVLRSVRVSLEERARGPLMVLGSLPGEPHGLGLQMAATVLGLAGCRVLYVGTEVPPGQMAQLARDLGARGVAVGVSIATRGSATDATLKTLRRQLPRRVHLLVGGDGAPRGEEGMDVFSDLRELDRWARQLVAKSEIA